MARQAEIKNYYKDLPEERRTFAEKLLTKMFFMEQTLRKLETDIRKNGAVIETKNGNGFQVVQENPAQKTYNTMVKNYNATVKILIDMLPDSIEKTGDEFTEFLESR